MGEKEPFEDKSVSHGICPDCLKIVESEVKELAELGNLKPQEMR